MRIKKTICSLFFLMTAGITHANTITYNGYSLDQETHIITDPHGQEWLQWSETTAGGISVWDVESKYLDRGWKIATTDQMLELLRDFGVNFPKVPYAKSQYATFDITEYDNVYYELDLQLIALFGQTPHSIDSTLYKANDIKHSTVYFKEPSTQYLRYRKIRVLDDLISNTQGVLDSRGYIAILRGSNDYNQYSAYAGVALIRQAGLNL